MIKRKILVPTLKDLTIECGEHIYKQLLYEMVGKRIEGQSKVRGRGNIQVEF